MLFLAVAALALWLIILLLPWQPWLANEKWDAARCEQVTYLGNITVLIPARNEMEVIGKSIQSVLDQGSGLQIIVIDDQSTDNTYVRLKQFVDRISVIHGTSPPPGWSGKLWALEQGRKEAKTDLLLLLDADIMLQPGVIAGLQEIMNEQKKDLVSLMAKPAFVSFWECLLMPAFVYYFKLLYPFSLANSTSKQVAAAAGGCILVKSEVLEGIGGFSRIGTTLIDDCQLALEVKKAGFITWLGLTHSISSIRTYQGLTEIWNMVARTAYTQLSHSILLLLLCTGVMLLAYFVPLAAQWSNQTGVILGMITLLIMCITYLPVLNYYHRSWLWASGLPLVAVLFLGMTWTSAWRYWSGERMRWRGRVIHANTKHNA